MRRGNQPNAVDRISGLPVNIIDTILSCLPLRDAVRTSILSRKWRHNYVNVPKLVFNENLFWPMRSPRDVGEELVSVVHQVLLLHRGPIAEFELSLPPRVQSYSGVDRFMTYLSWNAVEKLTLSISGDEFYKLPSSFYSCQELKVLYLINCIFKPPPSLRVFSRLTSLEFYNVIIDSEIFGSFVSKCVLLESLTVANEDEYAYQSFIIDAPKLKFMCLGGILNPIRFKRAPLLEAIEMYPVENGEASVIKLKKGEVSNFEILRRLPIIEKMKISDVFLKSLAAGSVPVKRLNVSMPLKVLEIVDIKFAELDAVSSALDIIRSSTNLQKLVIQIYYSGYDSGPYDEIADPVLEYLKAQDYSDINLDQLQKVKIGCFQGLKVELEFIKLLLATSTILEEVLIEPDFVRNAEKKYMMSRDLLQFERASRRAKIIIVDRHLS